jgi:3-phosphoshikimate 1-carboxyvinyltransferase
MDKTVTAPSTIDVSIMPASSKSISARALLLNALSSKRRMINNISDCEDTVVLAQALREIKLREQTDRGIELADVRVDIGAAGTAMRFLTAFYAAYEGLNVHLTGSSRMCERPIKLLVDALRELGGMVSYAGNEGYPPLSIQGSRLNGGSISLDGSVSSQYISALLMIAPKMRNGLQLTLEGKVASKPYIEMTLALMRTFGVNAKVKGETISIKRQRYRTPKDFWVEGDWSAASYWYEAVALCPDPAAKIELKTMYKNSLQGDKAVAGLFSKLGVATEYHPKSVLLTKKDKEIVEGERLEYDFLATPDLAQTAVVTCAMLGVPFRFTGLQSLRIKETDRLQALHKELLKCGVVVSIESDSVLSWDGTTCERWALPVIETYKDHRMAMSFAPAAFVFPKGIYITDVSVVCKSYPDFWEDMEMVGFRV